MGSHEGAHADATVPGPLHIRLRDASSLGQIGHLHGQRPGGTVVSRHQVVWHDSGGVLGDAAAGDVAEAVEGTLHRLIKGEAVERIDLGWGQKDFTDRLRQLFDPSIE